jgi:hypothetical protein
MGMMDKALEIGASADWLTPTFALVRTQILRTHVQFGIDKNDILDAKLTLDKKRIRMQDCVIVDGACLFTVRNEHARWAADLLARAGVQLWNAEHVAKNAPRVRKRKATSKRATKTKRQRRSAWAKLWD